MTLNASGPISLAGATTGQSIAVELGGTGTTQISLNDATVRALAGVASGAITMPTDFWGKSSASYVWYAASVNETCWCCSPHVSGQGLAPYVGVYGAVTYPKSNGTLLIWTTFYSIPTSVSNDVGTQSVTISTSGTITRNYSVTSSITNSGIYQDIQPTAVSPYITYLFYQFTTPKTAYRVYLMKYNIETNTYTALKGFARSQTNGNLAVTGTSAVGYASNGNFSWVTITTGTAATYGRWTNAIFGSTGTTLSCKRFQGGDLTSSTNSSANKYSLADTSNNFYCFNKISGGTYAPYCAIIKYNSSGVIQWQNKYTATGTSTAGTSSFTLNPNTGDMYVVLATTTTTTTNIIKINSSGTVQWANVYTFPNPINSGNSSIFYDSATGYIVFAVGTGGVGSGYIYLLWIDSSGAVIRARSLSSYDAYAPQVWVANGSLGISFLTNSFVTYNNTVPIMQSLKLPSDGSQTKTSGYGSTIIYQSITVTSASTTATSSALATTATDNSFTADATAYALTTTATNYTTFESSGVW